MKAYIKRVYNAVLNKPVYTMEKNYEVHTDGKHIGKVALVTGGSGAIGSAIAKRLALDGAEVYIAGRNVEKLDQMAGTIGENVHSLQMDVSDYASVADAARLLVSVTGKIDILVNCAGGSTRDNCANLVDQSVEMIDMMIESNLRGSMLCTKVFGKFMEQSGYGRIINIASVIGEHGKPRFSDYAAAKAGIIGYTKSVAQELGPSGVTVNCVSPGFVQRGEFAENRLPYLLNSNFLNRVGCAEDIASAVCFLASDEAGFITGQNLCVDGGRSLGLHGD